MDEKRKLKLIKYNKNLQNNTNVNLINYKFFSGKYVIYENRKGKEYNGYSDELRFEGEYFNDEKNGKGKQRTIILISRSRKERLLLVKK